MSCICLSRVVLPEPESPTTRTLGPFLSPRVVWGVLSWRGGEPEIRSLAFDSSLLNMQNVLGDEVTKEGQRKTNAAERGTESSPAPEQTHVLSTVVSRLLSVRSAYHKPT